MTDRSEHEDFGPARRVRQRARRKPAVHAEPAVPSRLGAVQARAIVIAGVAGEPYASLAPRLAELQAVPEAVCSADEARSRLTASALPDAPTLLVADARDEAALALLRELALTRPSVVPVLVTDEPTLDLAVDAMRCGAADLLEVPGDEHTIRTSLSLAIDRARTTHHRELRVERLRSVCRQLNTARQQITSQVSGMCNDLVEAYQELSGQIDTLALCGEFNGVVRQELDIESLLRVVLEFLLAKVGPTNAAIFLPSSGEEFSLGAYVNCDLNPETIDSLLDHLAESLAPRFEHRPGVHVFETRRDTTRVLGGDAHWLADRAMVVFPCHQDDECLAVVALFRDDRQPFDAGATDMLRTLASLFAAQLSRIIHVHHRHLPRHQWGALGDGPDDWHNPEDLDQAA
ncbi:MAG: GAF domain-containing protein [Phycisphaerales bacterium]